MKTIIYVGPSMHPTLKPLDKLKIVPYRGRRIGRGDVVVFIPPGEDSQIVHRVTSVNSDGIKTRGDNSTYVDPWVLSPDQIIGFAVSARRGNRRLRVFGGFLGHSLAVAIRAVKNIDSNWSSLLGPFYQRLARVGHFRRWLPASMKTRAIALSHPAGTELQLLMGRRVIGRWLPGMIRWHIRRPFRLFVDEEALPENTVEVSGVRSQVSGTDKAEC